MYIKSMDINKMKNKSLIVVIAIITLLSTGCSSKRLVMTADAISSQELNQEALYKNFIKLKDSAEISNTIHMLYIFPIGEGDGTTGLLEKMEREYDADLITNIRYKNSIWTAILYSQMTETLTADIWKKKLRKE